MIMPTQIRVTDDCRQALLATAARAQQVTAATRPLRSTTPRPAGRVLASLSHAVAPLVALVVRLTARNASRPESSRRTIPWT